MSFDLKLNHYPAVLFLGFLFLGFMLLGLVTGESTQAQIQNGQFAAWDQGHPTGWQIGVGARSGDSGQKSIVKRADDGSLELSGNAGTTQWQLVSQSIDLKPGDSWMISFEARSQNLKREPRQFDNCYVGVFLQNAAGKNIRMQVTPVLNNDYAEYTQWVAGKQGVSKALVVIFLSKTGALNVRKVVAKKVTAEQSFDVLVSEMSKNYSYFEHKKIDWEKLTSKYAERARSVATQPEKFIAVITEMLAEMKDSHIWVTYQGIRISKYRKRWTSNYSFSVVDKDLSSVKRFGRLGMVGRTSTGLGYVRVTSLSGIKQTELDSMVREIEGLFDTPAIIVDLRRNGGGAEPIAQQIASLFAAKQVLYGRQKIRSGPRPGDLREAGQRYLVPRKGKTYQKPVACLIGPGVVSSAEGFAMMFAAINHCTMIGQPTRGASGNPAPLMLPNGVEVWYSRWVSMLPDGKVLEDYGVQPDITVPHERGTDRTFDKAQEFLTTKK